MKETPEWGYWRQFISVMDSWSDGWNVRNCSASQVQICGGRWNVQNSWWMKCTKSANFLRSLKMNTAEFGCPGCVCVFSCLVCMRILMLSFIKLGCIRCRCDMKEDILNCALYPLCLVYMKFLMPSVIKLRCKRCIDWKR